MYKYRCVDENGDTLLATDDRADVRRAYLGEFGKPDVYAVLVWGDDGEYHIDESW